MLERPTKTPREELKSRIAVEAKAKAKAKKGKPAKLTATFKSPILNFKADARVKKEARVVEAAYYTIPQVANSNTGSRLINAACT